MATVLPELTIDGVAITEAEINNLIKSCFNSFREILTSSASGVYDYKIGTKSVNRIAAMQYLKDMIIFLRELASSIPKEEILTTDYEIDDFGRDLSEYTDEDI